jgi:hypothetical protein
VARPRTLPDDDRELQYLLAKHTMTDIARMYGLTVQAVSKAVKDRNIPHSRGRQDYKRWVPWTIAVEHENFYARRCLRFWAMRQAERPLRDSEEQQLNNFLRKLEETGTVVQYEPHHPTNPWILVPRREGIDTTIIRKPASLPGTGKRKLVYDPHLPEGPWVFVPEQVTSNTPTFE